MNTTSRAATFLLLPFLLAPSVRAQVFVAGSSVSTSREAAKRSVEDLPIHAKSPPGQLLEIAVTDGMLSAALLLDLPNRIEPYRIEVEGTPAIWTVRKRMLGAANSLYVIVTRYDFDAPEEEYWSTMLTIRASYLAINAMRGNTTDGMRVRLTQSNGMLSFTCTSLDRGAQNSFVNFSASTLKQLQAEHPQEVRKYLIPMLHNLTGRNLLRPGATDVYRVFNALRPDPQVAKRLDDLLIRLESDVYAVRDQASKDLHSLGSGAVLAALRRDTGDLSAEARNRLDLFISNHSNLPLADARAALKDGPFLLDCLDDEDANVRAAAKSALEKLLGQSIEFNPTQDDQSRATAVDALRKKLDPILRPTTRPATTSRAPALTR
jgi:hypothetical protein